MNGRLAACLWCCLAAYVAFPGAARAQAPVLRIRHQMMANFNSTPDFMCTVSFARSERTGKAAPVPLPPVQAEGGVVADRELYAWPSSDTGVAQLREVLALFGKLGTGAFALYSRAVFSTADATFYDGPQENVNGRTLSRVDFAMPKEGSGALGYSGTIWFEPESLAVARMTMQPDNIPPELGLKIVSQTVDYGRGALAGTSVLLPVGTELTIEDKSGKELRITGTFSDFHKYVAKQGDRMLQNGVEKTVPVTVQTSRTEPPATVSRPKPPAPPAGDTPTQDLLPQKTRIETILDEAIDERTTKAGSRLTMTIVKEIKAGNKVIVPRGSLASAHVTRIIIQNYAINTSIKQYYLVGIQFDTIEVGKQVYPVRANLESVGEPAKGTAFIPYSHDPDKWGDFDDIYQLLLCPAPERDESFLGIVREFLRISGKLRVYWSTQEPVTK